MRHGVSNRKFGRNPTHRRALLRNMATSLLKVERFYTTVEKAKDLRRVVEPLITLGKKDSLHARRKAYSYLLNKKVVQKLFADIGPRFKGRAGGYLRIVRADRRHGDAAEMAFIELVEKPKAVEKTLEAPAKKEKKAAKPKAKAKSKAKKAE